MNTQENIINSLNPTGGVFVDYKPETRATAKLGSNIRTLAETAGKKPEDLVAVYRGAEGQTKIKNGDFVTTNKNLAIDYAGGGSVISGIVRYGDILDDITEPLGDEYILRLGAYWELN